MSNSGVSLLGYWHSHAEDLNNPDGATQPSSGAGQDKDIGDAIKQFETGGVGIIVNQNSITIYPLNDHSGNTNTNVDQNTTELNLFNVPFNYKVKNKPSSGSIATGTTGTAVYPSFNENVTPVKRSSVKP